MKSSLSFCNRTVLFKNVRRFAPLWAMYLAGMLLIGPVMLGRLWFSESVSYRTYTTVDYMGTLVRLGWFMSFVYALLCAVSCFSYLHKTSSAYMLHALPVKRSTWYGTNLITGLLFALVPMLLSALLCLVLLLSFGIPNAFGLAFGTLLNWVLQYLCFFGVAVFCMMLTGRTVIGVLTYLAVNGLGALLPLLVCATIEPLFYGFSYRAGAFLPFAPILWGLNADYVSFSPALSVWLYAAAGVLLLVLGWLHYRKRQLERVGDAMIYTWAKIVFQILFTALCALGIGWILWMVFSGFDSEAIYRAFLPFLLCLSVGCFIGWFGARMMLKRTVRVFQKRGWLGWGVAVAVLCVFVFSLRFDLFGLQKYVPAQSSVVSVDVQASWTDERLTLSDEAQIGKVLQIHGAILNDRSLWEADDGRSNSNPVTITYRLRSGLSVRRSYGNDCIGAEARNLLTELYRNTALAEQFYRQRLTERIVNFQSAILLCWDEDGYTELPLQSSTEALRSAILSDAAQGRLPIESYFTEKDLYADSKTDYRLVLTDADPEQLSPDRYYGYSGYYLEDGRNSYSFYLPPSATQTLSCFGITE